MKDAKSFPESEMFLTPTAWWADQMTPVHDTRIGHTEHQRRSDRNVTEREMEVFREWMDFNKAKFGRFYGSDEPNWDDVTQFIVPGRMYDYRWEWDERHPLEAFTEGRPYKGEMYRRGAVLDLNLVRIGLGNDDNFYQIIHLENAGWYQHLAMANFLHDLADFDTRGGKRWRAHARIFEDRVIWLAMPKSTWRCRPFVDGSDDSAGWWNHPRRIETPVGYHGAHRIDGFPDGLPRDEWLICYEGFFGFPSMGHNHHHRNTQTDARIEFRNALGFHSDEAYLAGREAITKRRREAASGWIST